MLPNTLPEIHPDLEAFWALAPFVADHPRFPGGGVCSPPAVELAAGGRIVQFGVRARYVSLLQ